MLNKGTVKPFRDYPELLEILKNRGLKIEDEAKALEVLKYVGYYRLSAYSLTLRKNDVFYPGTTFDNVYSLYLFDTDFRHIILKYCCIVEVAFRNYVSHYHAGKYGPLGYLNPQYFDDAIRHSGFLSELDKEVTRSDDAFIVHHKKDLDSVYPVWAVLEVSSFGKLSKMFKNMLLDDRTELSKQYINRGRSYVENWLQCCSYCRNVAAHGGRFYNRLLKSCPVRLNKKVYSGINNTSPFAFVIAIHSLLPTSMYKSVFVSELVCLFHNYPFALKRHLGFPDDWETYLSP